MPGPNRPLQHLNGDIICSIDVETTGLTPGYHDIVQFACIPLDANYKPHADILPLDWIIRPSRPFNVNKAAMRLTQLEFDKVMAWGLDPNDAADLFDEWFKKLKLAWNKRIQPLGQNLYFDIPFIKDWLGISNYESKFSPLIRDTLCTAIFTQDCNCYMDQTYVIQHCNLGYMSSTFGIERHRKHDALDDARVTAMIYKALMTKADSSFTAHQLKIIKDALWEIHRLVSNETTTNDKVKEITTKALSKCRIDYKELEAKIKMTEPLYFPPIEKSDNRGRE